MTEKEKINKMSAEELAKFLADESARCKLCGKTICGGYNDCYEGILKALNREVERTADEMFADLGYAVPSQEDYTVKYRSITTPYMEIRLHNNVHDEWEYEKYFVDKNYESMLITQKEDVAIHKKISELKSGVEK